MGKHLSVLFVDDSPNDVELMVRKLKKSGYDPMYERVETATAMKTMLEKHRWDIILADHTMPLFNAMDALTQLQLSGLDLPFIIVSGTIGEDVAVAAMKAGAHDYVMKDKLIRLIPAIERELKEAEERRKRKQAEEALRKSEASLANAQRIAHLGNWERNIAENTLFWSDEIFRIFGLIPRSCISTYEVFFDSIHPDDREYVKQSVHNALSSDGKPYCIDYRIILPDGSERFVHEQAEVVFDKNGRAIHMSGTIQDITECRKIKEELRALNESLEQKVAERTLELKKANEELQAEITERKRMEEKIKHLAFHDPLTSLPNRTLFADRLTLALAHAHRTKEILAILFLDLDRFKVINDTLGHSIGDQLLQGVAERLKHCVREDDTVARLGGDEFILLLTGISRTEDVDTIARKILNIFKESWVTSGHELHITVSIGIALYPNDGKDAETLLKNADTAMYRAKESGRNNYQFYTPIMHNRSLERLAMETGLRRALERKEFVVYYQPQVNLDTGKMTGMEALVRWQHPDEGIIFPSEFLALAEDTRQIIFIDELVLHVVCKQIKIWQDMGLMLTCVSVNLSMYTFQQQNFVETVASVIKKNGLDPHLLGVEITESIAMCDIDTTIDKLNKLSDLGIQITIDDFGTGFSSLGYLKKFPIDKLKISQHFIDGA
ncbi:MAG: diguanylate cyclase domain-containing protein [Candidatus Loosdrechtia sp.]|uniref:diguanylate cyclase domain-containing protein n=1 Tax=Candidatus Loosdrechtia sp. TaxID=3101272 RepID=UPI003A62AB30|nr:MAG: diguanylate cyclase [Candidatus Jettenia sp. AMX2]